MTNAEKFVEVFGTDLKRQYSTKSWWDQEFIEQEPCEDCVSRQAVLSMQYRIDVVNVDDIDDLLPVTPAKKVGQWIVHEKPHGIRYLECPYCNIWYLNEHLIRNSYCPNCGAKMQEVEKKE